MVTLEDVLVAHERIRPYVRRTPLMRVAPVKSRPFEGTLSLKLECLQITGSFKPRGAMNKLLAHGPEAVKRGIVTASGGNHGLAVAYLGWFAKVPATVYLPHTSPQVKADKIRQWGAQVVMEGNVWDEANAAAQAFAGRENIPYFHPFADPLVIAGQGTIALETFEDAPEVDTLLVAIGGGGLISGISLAAKALKPSVRVIGVEPVGAPKLLESLKAGHLIELPAIHTAAGTLAPRQSDQINLDIIKRHVDEIVLVTDEEMYQAAEWLWFELGVAAEISGAAALAALLTGKVTTPPNAHVCVLVCGAGTAGIGC